MKKIIRIIWFSAMLTIVAWFIAIMCCSCGISKSSIKTKAESEYSTNAKKHEESKTNELTNKKEAENTTEVSETETVEYDTTIVNHDGSSPVKSKTTNKTTKVNGKVMEEIKVVDSAVMSDEAKTESGKDKSGVVQDNESKHSMMSYLSVIAWSVIVTVLFITVYRSGVLRLILNWIKAKFLS